MAKRTPYNAEAEMAARRALWQGAAALRAHVVTDSWGLVTGPRIQARPLQPWLQVIKILRRERRVPAD